MLRQQQQATARFLASPAFQDRVSRLQRLPDKQGILISAGKPHHVGNTAVILHALRMQYGCTLPVEIAYRGDKELDPVTRKTLAKAFAPLHFLDLEAQQYPAHHYQGYTMDRYEPKIYALYHSRFQQVLMLDADSLPLMDPSHLFGATQVVQHGNMFWLDLWNPLLASTTFVGHDSVYRLLGIDKQQYWDVLSAGQGHLHRVAESGQVVFDRVRHADVLEYLWYLTSFSSVLYKHVLGDKDTFGFAFALAGKLHELYSVATPPAVAFKDEDTHWRFHAMVQYDHVGHPTFFHRTFEKWNDVLKPPPLMDVVTGPLPTRFIVNYMGNKSVNAALTPDLPHRTLRPLRLSCPSPAAKLHVAAQHGSRAEHSYVATWGRPGVFGGCPLSVWLEYQQLRDFGLPVARQLRLEAACLGIDQQLFNLQPATATAAAGRYRMAHRPPGKQPGASMQRHLTSQSVLRLGVSLRPAAAPGGSQEPLGGGCETWDSAAMWGRTDAAVWLRACRAQRQAMAQAAATRQSQQQQHDEPAAGAGDEPAAAAAAASSLLQALPACESVEWSVAKYVLHDAAEAFATDSAGKLRWDPQPLLPVLQLVRAHAGAVGEDSTSTSAASPCDFLDGAASPVDHMQLETIPAARDWVQAHLEGLPALHKSSS